MTRLLNSGFHPHIPLGYLVDPQQGKYSHGNAAFRLVPNTNLLQPTREMNRTHRTDDIVLPAMALGTNFNVRLNAPYDWDEEDEEEQEASDYSEDDDLDYEPRSLQDYAQLARKVARFSVPGKRFGKFGRPDPEPQSDQSTSKDRPDPLSQRSGDDSTLNDETGFAFYQLGALHYCPNMPDAKTEVESEIFAKKWYKTDYVVVAKITQPGHLGPVWLLWNFWASRDDDEDRPEWEQPQLNFPGSMRFFTAAEIADSFGDLATDRMLNISTAEGEIFDKDFELTGCIQTPAGTVVRQWVI